MGKKKQTEKPDLHSNAAAQHEVRVMPLASLKGWKRNPRTIQPENLTGLKGSLDRWGLVEFPVWNQRTGTLVGGHQRVRSLRESGVTETQVVVVDLPEEEAEALGLALNNPEIAGEFTTEALGLISELRSRDQELAGLLNLDILDTYLKEFYRDEILDAKREKSDIPKPDPNGVTDTTDASAAAAEPEPEDTFGEYVPDIVYPTDNDFGIPTLDLKLQVEDVVRPIVRWGYVARTNDRVGFVHFYTDDYRFRALWEKPGQLLRSGAKRICEPNFTATEDFPRAYNLFAIYKKRWLARFWQSKGIACAVDMFVGAGEQLNADNLLGVPKGWRAYSTKLTNALAKDMLARDAGPEEHKHFAAACARAGSRDILFLVAGGGQAGEELCKRFGWIFLERLQSEE